MKCQKITAPLIVAASVLVVSVALTAQDRFTLKVPNGIAFSEFKGYEAWQVIAPSQGKNESGREADRRLANRHLPAPAARSS
jgi:hypothetical protein